MDVLDEIRAKLGPAPRRFSWWSRRGYLAVSRPAWAKNDALAHYFDSVPRLLREGHVTWGRIVQSNELLFEPGYQDCPGEVIYGADPATPLLPAELTPIAEALFALKGTQPEDPAERKIAEHLTNETTRVFGLPAPDSLCAWRPCRISTIFFPRKHLPDLKLSLSHFPILVSPADDGAVMVVPSRYWPAALIQDWKRAG